MENEELEGYLSETVTDGLVIPTCEGPIPAESWVPGHLSFQLVLSGQIPTTPWCDTEERVLGRGGLICCAAGAASTRRYDVDRQHLSFDIHGGHLTVQLFERQANDDPKQALRKTWRLSAPVLIMEMEQVLNRAFHEGQDRKVIATLATAIPPLLLHSLKRKEQPLLIKARSWLHEHAHEEVDRNDLARYLGCHPDHVTRLFKSVNGSFVDERKRWRCEKACSLLMESRLMLAEIASRCGFNSETNFIRSFKQMYGSTPGEWRRTQIFPE